eukprot:Pgem_evm1s4404
MRVKGLVKTIVGNIHNNDNNNNSTKNKSKNKNNKNKNKNNGIINEDNDFEFMSGSSSLMDVNEERIKEIASSRKVSYRPSTRNAMHVQTEKENGNETKKFDLMNHDSCSDSEVENDVFDANKVKRKQQRKKTQQQQKAENKREKVEKKRKEEIEKSNKFLYSYDHSP